MRMRRDKNKVCMLQPSDAFHNIIIISYYFVLNKTKKLKLITKMYCYFQIKIISVKLLTLS